MRQAEPNIEAFQEMEAWITPLTRPATQDTPAYDALPIFQQAIRDLIDSAISKLDSVAYHSNRWDEWKALQELASHYQNISIPNKNDTFTHFKKAATQWIQDRINEDSTILTKESFKEELKNWAKEFGISVPQLGI